MAQQTAVEWLTEQLKKQGFLYDLDIEAAKRMERKQIEEAFTNGKFNGWDLVDKVEPSNYYTQTYGEWTHTPHAPPHNTTTNASKY